MKQQRQEPDVYVTLLVMLAVGLVVGAAIAYSVAMQHGISIGTVTATEGVLTVTGDGCLAVDGTGLVLRVTEMQGGTVRSTCYLRQWTRVKRVAPDGD